MSGQQWVWCAVAFTWGVVVPGVWAATRIVYRVRPPWWTTCTRCGRHLGRNARFTVCSAVGEQCHR